MEYNRASVIKETKSFRKDQTWNEGDRLFPRGLSYVPIKEENEATSSMDDVKSAALALTSLSLSPAHAWSPDTDKPINVLENRFTYPENETCFHAGVEDAVRERNTSYARENLDQSDVFRRHVEFSPEFPTTDKYQAKPRSYSQRDFGNTRHPEMQKQRSYSFDAFGRAGKYIRGVIPLTSSRMIYGKLGTRSIDDGIGTSSESVDQFIGKRKFTNGRVFRCMWRGCEKEMTSLSGIILHVRHAHIGPSNAGEEEFYFDDVKMDSSSGVSSSDESVHDEIPLTKYRKGVNEAPKLQQQPNEIFHRGAFVSHTKIWRPDAEHMNSDISLKSVNNVETISAQDAPNHLQTELKIKFEASLSTPNTPSTSNFPFLDDMSKDSVKMKPLCNFICRSQPGSTSHIFTPEETAASTSVVKGRNKSRKKCRKVYGMSNKHLWCTQCRWKKACVRFT